MARSIEKGNGLFVVNIAGIKCMKNGTCSQGQNPLDSVGLYLKPIEQKVYICEKKNGKWEYYGDFTPSVSWPTYLPKPGADAVQPLSAGTRVYDYASQDGYRNFSSWVSTAASAANR